MKITVETIKSTVSVDEDFVVILVGVDVDGKAHRGLQKQLSTDELKSHFDVIWQHIGDEIKKSYRNS